MFMLLTNFVLSYVSRYLLKVYFLNMFDHPILPLVLAMWIVTCKGTGAVTGQTQQQPIPPGLRLVQVSLQQCIQVYFLILICILLVEFF